MAINIPDANALYAAIIAAVTTDANLVANVNAAGGVFADKWAAAMATYAVAAAGDADAKNKLIATIVLLLKQLGIYNKAVDGAFVHAGAGAYAPVAGEDAGAVANSPFSAEAIKDIVNRALACWDPAAVAGACNNFVEEVGNYIQEKLAHHPSSNGMALAWKDSLKATLKSIKKLSSPAPDAAAMAAIDAGADAIDFGDAVARVPAFGGARGRKAARKTAKKAKKSKVVRKSVRKSKSARKTAKKVSKRKVNRKGKSSRKAVKARKVNRKH
jgi:hypothetical protein